MNTIAKSEFRARIAEISHTTQKLPDTSSIRALSALRLDALRILAE